MSVARYDLYATGNRSFGYFAAGYNDGGTNLSLIDRVDYSNDTATAVAKGPLSVARVAGQGVSSRENAIPLKGPGNLEVPVAFGNFSAPGTVPAGTDFGYIAGGWDPSTVSQHNISSRPY